MKLGIMQPYFLPYIGYWQLLNAVDEYVIYDDVNFINRGWIHRNRILIQGEARYIRLSISKVSQNRRINELCLLQGEKWREKLWKTIDLAYCKAPHYAAVRPIFERIIFCTEENVARFLANSIEVICQYLEIGTKIHISSEMVQNRQLKGEARILDICKHLKADSYYNAIGGQALYHTSEFKKHGISLHFLQSDAVSYPQFQNDFVEGLSILDVMMFCSKENVQEMLQQYKLL